MIVGLGIDLVENRRVEQEVARGDWLAGDGIFTSEEINYCRRAKKPGLRFAACFAAKEATLKALGVAPDDLGFFREAEVRAGRDGRCGIVLHRRLGAQGERLGVRQIRLAMASSTKLTGAMVILEA